MPWHREAMKDVASDDTLRGAASTLRMRRTEGSEPSQYLEEEKSIEIPSVAASEHGTAQTVVASAIAGLWGSATWSYKAAA